MIFPAARPPAILLDRAMEIRLDACRNAEVISPLLFGHNLEHTRSCVWRGLSAQLLRNRKLAGRPMRDGQPQEWYTLGPAGTFFRLEWTCLMARRRGETTFTRHFEPRLRRRGMDSQRLRVVCLRAGWPCGVGQDGLALRAGQRHTGRLALQCDTPMAMTITLRDDAGTPFWRWRVVLRPGGWREIDFAFAAPRTMTDARLEITTATPGSFWLGAASLLPEDHFHGMRRDVVALLKRLRPALLRWPGGNFAGDYCWQDGLLPVDRRAPLMSHEPLETQPHSGGFDNHEIGTDEFIALCREVGAEPFISLNIAWDSPASCAAWVAYCNADGRHPWGRRRIARGHAAPFGVRHWSLGNEIGYSHMEGGGRPAAYARKAAACVAAMRAVDPGLILVSSGNWDRPEWISEGLKRVTPLADHISHHRYTPLPADPAGRGAAAGIRAVTGYPQQVRRDLRRIRRELARHTPAGRFVGLSFDEWNVWYAWYARPRLLDGLHAALMQQMLIRDAAGLGVTIACYFQPVNEGAIRVDAHRAGLTPAGRMLAWLADHQQHRRLSGRLAAGPDTIDVVASRDDTTGDILLTAVNPALRRAATLTVVTRTPAHRIRARVLAGATPLSTVVRERPLPAEERGRGRVVFRLPPFCLARIDLPAAT